MKIRNGFVSNSSTSSFIVTYKESTFSTKKSVHQKCLLTKKEIDLLEKFGFRKTTTGSPFVYDHKSFTNSEPIDEEDIKWSGCYFGYEVSCNQDAVIRFLIKNKISFTASCHYDHMLVIYDKNKDYFYEVANLGFLVMSNLKTYSVEKTVNDNKPITKVMIKKYLKDTDFFDEKDVDCEFEEFFKSLTTGGSKS